MRSSECRNGVRYAPSPSGRLHLGNLRTGWIAKEIARRSGGVFVVRVEDIDGPRVVPGAADVQLSDLAAVGAKADRLEIQSAFGARHREVFDRAVATGAVYPCTCSRRQVKTALESLASAPHRPPPVYDGRCRAGAKVEVDTQVGWRWRAADRTGVDDVLVARTQGPSGAFQPAYHWACAIDDWDGRFAWLVRAWDLDSARGPQRAIQAWLRQEERSADPLPRVFHTATVVDAKGVRLEKRSQGVTLPELLAAGWTGESIAAAFARSFRGETGTDDGGEAMREIAVTTLLTR